MQVLSELRAERGLSQRALAAKAAMSFRGVQHLEAVGHDWRASSVEKIAVALGLAPHGMDLALRHFLTTKTDSVEDVSIRIVVDGVESWKTHLFNFVDAFRSGHGIALVERAPISELAQHLRALLASTVEALCDEGDLSAPSWCVGVPGLPTPWFVSGIENLKAMALVESPVRFRARNIFVLANFLSRA